MTHWLYPANVKFYDVFGALSLPETYWPINSKVSTGDIVYIYLSVPYKQIGFACDVAEIDLDQSIVVDKVSPFIKGKADNKKQTKRFMRLKTNSVVTLAADSALSYSHLKQNGLNGMLMGPRKLENNPILLDYIKKNLR